MPSILVPFSAFYDDAKHAAKSFLIYAQAEAHLAHSFPAALCTLHANTRHPTPSPRNELPETPARLVPGDSSAIYAQACYVEIVVLDPK
jgi:hypothetical protein